MIDLGRRPRGKNLLRFAVAVATCLAAVVGSPTVALAQRIANQFNDASSNATQGPNTSGQSGPGGTATTNLVPHIQKSVSRPEGWPGSGG